MRASVRDFLSALQACEINLDGSGRLTSRVRHGASLGMRRLPRNRIPIPPAGYGFTLIELLVALAILAILLVVAIPSFAPTLRSNRLFATQTEVMSSLALARSEAAKRGIPVSVIPNAPPGAISGDEWGPGWSVWVDQNANGVVDSGEVLRAHEASPSGFTLSVPNSGVIKFDAHGFLSPAVFRQLKVCSTSRGTPGYQITIQPNGLVDSASVTCP
jgi:type IV fimbrial biogenesis protein FimT